jgi:hypothetical protein
MKCVAISDHPHQTQSINSGLVIKLQASSVKFIITLMLYYRCESSFHIKGKDQAIKQGAIEKLLPRIQIFGLAALMR